MLNKKKLLIIGVLVLAVGGLGFYAVKRQGSDVVEVQATKVKRGTVIHKVSASGKVNPVIQVNVSADVAGRVIRLAVKEGDRVVKGQFLAQLDSTRYKAEVDRAKQVLASAQAQLKVSKLEKEQQYELFKKNLVSELQYQQAEARYTQALASMRQAEAALTQALDNYNKTTIVAPMSGVITLLNKREGEIALGSTFQRDIIMTIADLSQMEILASVNENDVVDVALGDTAEISIDAMPDTTFLGVVTEIAHSAKTVNSGSLEQVTNFDVKVRFLNPPPDLRPGMSASVDIRTATHQNVLYVPIQCVTLRNPSAFKANRRGKRTREARKRSDSAAVEKRFGKKEEPVEVVFVIKKAPQGRGEIVEMRRVRTGLTGEENFEIISGLKEGERVVSGPYRILSRELNDGDKVKVARRKRFHRKDREA